MSLNSEQLLINYQKILEYIDYIVDKNTLVNTPQLLVVSKTQPTHMIQTLYEAGQRNFGENYLQDALEKIITLKKLKDICWHFIGQIQSNKTKTITQYFSWVHSVDRLKIANLLSQQRPDNLPPLNICLQVNLNNESQKGGIAPNELASIALAVMQLSKIKLRGLMCIPKAHDNFEKKIQCFNQLKDLQNELNTAGLSLDTLSMGMSKDLEAAITAGSTILRIGSDIFNTRNSTYI